MNLGDLLRLLQRVTGLELSFPAVTTAVRQRMKARGDTQLDRYLAEPFTDAAELQSLIDLVVVPESWFFRDAAAFEVALSLVRERMAAGRRPVRILSVPCAAGEEPYSIAIALTDAGIAEESFRIEGMDISRQVLDRAERGCYQRNAFRSRDLSFRDRHFTRRDNSYELRSEIRRLVNFQCVNLLDMETRALQRYFDLIFCRNLMIYFDDATQAAAAAKLKELLADDGLLFSGYAETAAFCRHGFDMAPMSKAFALAKKKTGTSSFMPLPEKASVRRPVPQRKKTVIDIPQLFSPPSPPVPEKVAAPTQTDALLAKARQLADAGDTMAAATAFRRYLEKVPDSAEAYFMLGVLNEHDRNEREAEACLRRAIYLDPGHYDALCHLALLAERAGDEAGAGKLRERARRVFRRRPEEQQSR